MTTSYPTGLDSLSNPASGDAMNGAVPHASQHANVNDAIEAIEAALGIGPFGTGDAQSMYIATTAQRLAVRKGTTASPDTTPDPLVKVERYLNPSDAAIEARTTGDAYELLAGISSIAIGTAAFTAQPVGVAGSASHSGTGAGSSGRRPDAVGLYGTGRVTGSGIGVGIGGFFNGRRDTDTGNGCGIEVHAANYGSVAGSYNSTGFPTMGGIWLNCSGNADSGVGLVLSNAFGRQFKVGLGFTAQVVGGLTGGVADSSIRDDSTSTTSLDIRGTHTYGLDLRNATNTRAIRLPNTTDGTGGIWARNAADSADISLMYLAASDGVVMGSNAASIYMAQNLAMADAKNITFNATTGTKIGTATTQKFAFWNATAVVQPTAVIDASGGAIVDAEARTALNALLSRMRTIGIIAA